MTWCEDHCVDYVFGLARNERLEKRIAQALDEARQASQATGKPARVFRDFLWSTRDSWSRRRRVIGKAEWTRGEANPRFVVTSLKPDRWPARTLYEELDLYADRTSAATMRANQLRLWFASFAYVLMCALRRIGLAHGRLATATCGTIRTKLLKIGAQVRVSVRRVKIAMATACPYANEFASRLRPNTRRGRLTPPDRTLPVNHRGHFADPSAPPPSAAATALVRANVAAPDPPAIAEPSQIPPPP
jgi:hypothetical protein